MKGNKKILLAALLLLLISVTFGTYAIYRSSISGTGTVRAAKWNVKFKKGTTEIQNFNFGYNDVTWTSNPGKNNTIAPGATGYIEFEIDATGSEVDVVYTATVEDGVTEGITASVGTTGEQTITYNATSMKATVRVNVTWNGALTDNSAKDTSDMELQNTNLSIPIKVVARQAL